MLLTVAVSSFPTIVLYNIGWYDTLTILGAAIVAIGRHPVWAVAGVAVMASANPSEAVAAAVALLLIAIAGRWDELGPRAVAALATSLVIFGGATLWLRSHDVEGRSGEFRANLRFSIESFLQSAPLSVLAWYGGAWIMVVVLIRAVDGRARQLLALAGLVGVPAAVSVMTLDGTRVFAAIAAMPFLVTLVSDARRSRLAVEWNTILLGALLLVPALYIRGDTRSVWMPFSWLWTHTMS